jgi:predicted amidophosphoribosyltransferase
MGTSIKVALRALADLTLPPTCASCGAPDASLCQDCRRGIPGCLWDRGPRWVAPDPAPVGMPPVVSSGRYEGPVAHLLSAYKDDGRRDCEGVLGELLSASVQAALVAILSDGLRVASHPVPHPASHPVPHPASHPVTHPASHPPPGAPEHATDAPHWRGRWPVLVVPIPSSAAARRRRGDSPLVALGRRATRDFTPAELRLLGVLRHRRRLADQAGLDAAGRAANLERSMAVRSRWQPLVSGSACVLVDDVLTTGATITEAARALREAGASDVRAATICATQRRSSRPLSQ